MIYFNFSRDPNSAIEFSYSEKLFLNVGAWRDKHSSLVGRVTTELALVGVALIALIEFFIRSQIAWISIPFSKYRYEDGAAGSLYTLIFSIYALAINLFSPNFSARMLDLEARFDGWIIDSVCQNGNYDTAEMLLRKEWVRDKFHNILPNGTTDSLRSRLYGYPKLNPLFDLNDYEKGYLELKDLSHWLGLKGNVELCGNILSLESMSGRWMFDSLATAIRKFSESKDFKQLKLGTANALALKEALNLAYTEHSAEKISQRVRDRKLSFLEAGWKNHGIGLAFYGNYMAVGNRGEGSYPDNSNLEVSKIDPTLFTPEIAREIDSFKSKELEVAKEYFYKTLPAKLSSSGSIEKDSLCTSFKSIAPFYSKGGHCSLAGKKAVVRFAWAMLLSDTPDEATLQRAQLESKIFTDWTAVELHKSITPEKFTGLKERKEVIAQAQTKRNRKWERLERNIRDPFKEQMSDIIAAFPLAGSFLATTLGILYISRRLST